MKETLTSALRSRWPALLLVAGGALVPLLVLRARRRRDNREKARQPAPLAPRERHAWHGGDAVEEASMESFPASDPPAY